MEPTELWLSFRCAFSDVLKVRPDTELVEAWAAHSGRTKFYRRVLDAVAAKMNLRCEGELFKVDFAMWTAQSDTSGEDVPIIFVETENNAFTCHEELRKLASITAPLKILIAVTQWDEAVGVWGSGSHKKKLLNHWQQIIRSYNSVWPRSGILGIIVGERRPDSLLCFHASALNPNGDLLVDDDETTEGRIEQLVFSKKLDWHRALSQ